MPMPEIDLTQQHKAALESEALQNDWRAFAARLDAVMEAFRETPVIPLKAMLRESIYD